MTKEVLNLSRQDEAFLHITLVLARTSTVRNRHAAIVVRGGNIIASGVNTNRNHPSILSPEHVVSGSTKHAERVALRRTKRAKGGTMYVARAQRSTGAAMYSRPCPECYEAIVSAGIKEIIYTETA